LLIYYSMSDVGFAVGGNSGINYLVLQVHYASVDSFRGKMTNINIRQKILHGDVNNILSSINNILQRSTISE